MACTGLVLSSTNSGSRTETGLGRSGTSGTASKSPSAFPGVDEPEGNADADKGN